MAAKRSVIKLGLICCGQTTWEAEDRLLGDGDLPLSQAGRQSVMAAVQQARALKAASIYHPHDEAAADTARLLAQPIRASTREVHELADPALGLLQGLTAREFSERFPSRYKQWMDDPLALAPPEGETIAEGAARISRAISSVLKRARSNEVAVVLHPVGLGLVRCALASRPLSEFRTMLEQRPMIERYAISTAMLDELEHAAAPASA